MGIFSSQKTLKMKDLEKILKRIRSIDSLEREYVKGLFRQYESGGITKKEVEEAIEEMRTNHSDSVDPQEAKKIEQALLEFLS